MVKLLIILLFFSFLGGQLIRLQFPTGISITLLDVFVILSFLVLLIRLRKNHQILSTPLTKPIFIFWLVCVISLIANVSWLGHEELLIASLYIVRFVLYVSTFFLVRTFTKSEGEFFFNALVFSGAITAIIGIVQFMFYPNLGNLSYLEWDNHLYRLFSVFLDPNFAAVIFSLVFLYFLQRTITLWGRISIYFFLFLFGAIITALSVFLTFSRTGMLSLVVGVVVLLIIMKQTKALLVCVSLFILSFFLLADIGVEGLNPLRTVSTRARIESASIATNIFLKNPVLGVGFNAYRFAQHKYGFRTSNKWKTSHADAGTDNSFLFVLATTGIIGFVSFIALIFTTINAVYRQVQIKGAGIPEVTLASIATIFISSLLLHTLFYPFVMIWFWGMMGLTLRDEL